MLVLNNIKKSKNTVAILTIMIMLSITFSYIGSSVLLNLGSFYDNKTKELNNANFCFIADNKDIYNESYSFIKNNKHTRFMETEDVLGTETSSFKSKGKDVSTQFIICDADKERTLSSLKLTEKAKQKMKDGIILSYNFKAAYGYNVGDKFTIKCNNKNLDFTVYGFFEDTLFCNNSDILTSKAYLYHDDYNNLKKSLTDNDSYKLIDVKTDTDKNSLELRKACINRISTKFGELKSNIICSDSANTKEGLTTFLGLLMSIIIAFSFVLIVIALTVIGYSIITYIADNVKNIGVLQAIGYVNRQVIAISLVQFMMITVFGCILGLAAAFIAAPYFSNIISSLAGLKWPVEINLSAVAFSVIPVLFLVFLIILTATRKIKKITPINALRDGIETHSFKKNHVSFDGYKGSLNFAISLKSIFHYFKQNCMITVIIFILAFVSVFATLSYYNFMVNDNFVMNMLGIQNFDIQIETDNNSYERIYNTIKDDSKIRKVVKLYDKSFLLNDESTRLYVCDNYSELEVNTVYSGRQPRHDNEIVISNAVTENTNKKIGDTIQIKIDGISEDFLIVGLSQHMTGWGRSVNITEAGFRRFHPDFKISTFGGYLKNSSDANIKSYIKALNAKYSNNQYIITNYKTMLNSVMDTIKSPTKLCISIFIFIIIAVVCLILFLIIKIRLIKDKQHMGILKALGYTTRQLMSQTVLSLMPIIIAGALAGTAAGILLSNSLMYLIVSSMGIYNCNLQINAAYIFYVIVLILAVSYIFSNLVAYRIRKITPCEEILAQ